MSRIVLRAAGARRGTVRVPGDKSISHRALLLAALADGTSRVRGLSTGADVASTAAAIQALGATIAGDKIGGGALHEPGEAIDAGNSGTTMRLVAGVCASRPWRVELTGDESLRRRPMDRVAEPLARMGARVVGFGDRVCPPIVVDGGRLHGIDYELPVASAQVKSAVLLAGLGADGDTVVRERVRTRAHTEELLARAGADIEVTEGGCVVRVRRSSLQPFALDVPGDPSQAAFWIVTALTVPGSEVTVEGVYAGPARGGFLEVLQRMGAALEVRPTGTGMVDIAAAYTPLRATDIAPDEVPAVIDELPVLAVAAAHASGATTVRGAEELRVKESDRIAALVDGLTALGADIEGRRDGFTVRGPTRWRGGRADARGDHRIAMSMAVAAMAIDGDVTIEGWDSVAISYPGFGDELLACG